MKTLHNRYRTTPTVTAADVAKWILACFPAAVLLALTFYPETSIPWLAELLMALK